MDGCCTVVLITSTSTMRLRSSKTSTGPDPAEGSSPVVTPDPATTSSANPSSSDLDDNALVSLFGQNNRLVVRNRFNLRSDSLRNERNE